MGLRKQTTVIEMGCGTGGGGGGGKRGGGRDEIVFGERGFGRAVLESLYKRAEGPRCAQGKKRDSTRLQPKTKELVRQTDGDDERCFLGTRHLHSVQGLGFRI